VETGGDQRRPGLLGEAGVGVDRGGVRRDLPLGDLADGVPDGLVLVGQRVRTGVVTHGWMLVRQLSRAGVSPR